MDTGYEYLEHTADAGITAAGKDMAQAFANAAQGMYSLMVEPEDVKEIRHRDVAVTATDEEGLLVAWLNELIYLFDAEGILGKRLEIKSLSSTRLEARVYGETVDRSRHRLKAGIKAATYHMLKIEANGRFKVQVLFDV